MAHRGSSENVVAPNKGDYYNSGSSEPAETSELVLNRLEAVSRHSVHVVSGTWIKIASVSDHALFCCDL